MITFENVSLILGTQPIFQDLQSSFQVHQKIGLVGRNGAGKSTLLKVIAGHQGHDGKIMRDGTKTIAYMPQEVVLNSTKSVLDELLGTFKEFWCAKERVVILESFLNNAEEISATIVEEYALLQKQLENFNEAQLRLKAATIAKGLGFTAQMLEQSVNELSVGWKMRIILAQLLLTNADFYLFDEPTNHLDIASKEWFLNFLRTTQSGYMLVSHDRYFLDHVCDHIYELERTKGTLYTGNFSVYCQQKEKQRAIAQATYERQQKEIARKQAVIDRFRAKATKAGMAQSMMKQLERIELVEVEPVMPTVSFKFPPVERAGTIVLKGQSLAHSFGERNLFGPLNVEISRGQKVAIIAPNGTGKTTLLNLLAQRIPLQKGSIEYGHNVKTAYFEQEQTQVLDPETTIFDTVRNACPKVLDSVIRTMLGSFLFKGDDIFKKTVVLSGGEKNRVAMVCVLLQNANFLMLDEPTNHLDLYAKQVLLKALQMYEGTVLFVSHDQDFVQNLATHILELTGEKAYIYPGTYQDYCLQKQILNEKVEIKKNSVFEEKINPIFDAQKSGKDQFLARKRIQTLESKITKLEQEQKELEKRFEQVEYGSEQYQIAEQKYQANKKQLAQLFVEWENLSF